jgi:hypothetical protein
LTAQIQDLAGAREATPPSTSTGEQMNTRNSSDVIVNLPVMTFETETLPYLAELIAEGLKSRGILVSKDEVTIKKV